jgi:presenilin-like A22 family membrane protease
MNLKTKEFWKIFLFEAFLFSLVFFFGILSAQKLTKFYVAHKISVPKISLLDFIYSLFFATLLILIIIFVFKETTKGRFLKAIFIFTSFLGSLVFLEFWLQEPSALIFTLFLIAWWFKNPNILNQNLLIIFGISGIGTFLGMSLDPENVIFLLILFSIYDVFAVYKTKHMVKMAKAMIKHKTILGIVAPQSLSGFKREISEVKPGGDFVIVGAGDLVFPLMFSVSCLKYNLLVSISIAIFTILGLLANLIFLFSQKERKPIPALPLISLFAIIGYLIGLTF